MDQLYVFGGTAKKGINSIEILDLTGTKNWEVVQLDIISGRGDCIFCPINDKDLLIMAGSDVNLKRDSFLFNVKKKKSKVVSGRYRSVILYFWPSCLATERVYCRASG